MRHLGTLALAGFMATGMAMAQNAPLTPQVANLVLNNGLVIGQPFIAVENITTTKTLSDGTTLTHRKQEQKWRDTAGRLRVQTAEMKADGEVIFHRVEIFDPVSHTRTTLQMDNKTAVVLHMPEGSESAQAAGLLACLCELNVRPGVQVRTETLPPKTVAGVYAVGQRKTKVRPAGTVGNDREIVSTSERYDSPDLKILLYSSLDDPREKMVREVTTLERREPDVAMFQVPAGFTVRDLPLHHDGQ